GHPIAMAYVPAEMATSGETVRIDLGGGTDAKIVDLPFYKRPS
ncbi:MAG: glycine cleavage system protein T, partial [Phycisphaeraceae bacterium]|nr:glycine cleavage system protein T [Phycisphaeraceae bacterium]